MADAFDYLAERDRLDRAFLRARGLVDRATLVFGNDTGPYQTHQIEGYPTELRSDVQRMQHFGMSAMPLPGAKGLIAWRSGNRAYGTILGVEDGRYRPTGLNPGEFVLYMVDGANAQGNGGTMRPILKGAIGGVGNVLGITINIGDSHTTTVTVNASTSVAVKSPRTTVSNGGSTQAVMLADMTPAATLFAQ